MEKVIKQVLETVSEWVPGNRVISELEVKVTGYGKRDNDSKMVDNPDCPIFTFSFKTEQSV